MTRDIWSDNNEPEFVERTPPFGLTARAWFRIQLGVVFLFILGGVSLVFWSFADRGGDTEIELLGEPFDDVLRIDSQALLGCDSDAPIASNDAAQGTIEHSHFRVLQTNIGMSLSPCSSIEDCETATFQRSIVPVPLDPATQAPAIPGEFSSWLEPSMELRLSGDMLAGQSARRFEIDGECHSIGRLITLRSTEAGERYELDEEVRFGSCEGETSGVVSGECQVRRRSVLVADGNL